MQREQRGQKDKTPAMKLAEFEQETPIEQLLTEGSLREVADKLGVSHTTIANWIKRREQRKGQHKD